MTKRILSSLLMAVLLITEAPVASAANEESILTSIGHSCTDTVTLSGSARNAVLTVAYDYAEASVDLANGLAISYDDTRYKSVVATPDSPGNAAVGGEDSIAITVSFHNINDPDDALKSRTVYYVRVVRAEATPATFSGVINKEVQSGQSISLSDITSNYRENDGNELGSIAISGSNLVTGTLLYNGGNYVFDTPISAASIGNLSFSASASGEVSYDIKAYEEGTSRLAGSAVLTITVYSAPTVSPYTSSIYVGASQNYAALNLSGCFNLQGGSLSSLELTPATPEFGAWYLDGTPLTSGSAHLIAASGLADLSFQGIAPGTATFTWRVSNAAGFSAQGSGTITVSAPTLTASSFHPASKLTKGNTWAASASHFSCSPSTVPVKYIRINAIPAAADGYLCLAAPLPKSIEYGYPAIAANRALAAGAIIPYQYIQYLKLATKSTAAGSSISFAWTATAESMVSSATWAPAASYTVSFATGGTVSYHADMNIPLQLSASDFSSVFSGETGYSLSYITFSLPAKTSGTLFYNYDIASGKGTTVSASTKYYTGSSPNLSQITFVPAKGYTGTVSMDYNGYQSGGACVKGSLVIRVTNSSGGTLHYTTDKNTAVQFDAADFSQAFFGATGKSLSYVKFTLPPSSCGRLYYGYASSSSYEAAVSASEKYYVYSSPYLSYLSFAPYNNFTGMATIRFTGYTDGGDSYSGKLIVLVVDSPAGIVTYASKKNGIVALAAEDFANEFISVTGSVLSYVVFTPPAATVGTLYTGYSAETGTGTKAAASTKYYSGSNPDISDITFVPAADYVGTVEVKYTVFTAAGVSYAGKLKIAVGETSSGTIFYTTDYNAPLALRASDFTNNFYSSTGGGTLSCVAFSTPSSTYGKLYYNYTASSGYGTLVSPGTLYYPNASPYLSSITFVPKKGYSGSFTINYTGYTADGTGYAGKISVTVGHELGTVHYQATSWDQVNFRVSDFQDAFEYETGKSLYYVKFTLPLASHGMLYYGYTSSGSYSAEVSSSTRYYANSTPYISRVTFVPNAGYSGALPIAYTAYDTSGNSFEGTVVITVTRSGYVTVAYETEKNAPIALNSSDFHAAFLEETGSSLSYVKFKLPAASYGRLYYNYTSSNSYSAAVSETTRYYRSSSPMISNITFVPQADYTGTVTIPYTCYNSSGNDSGGELVITVLDLEAKPFFDMGGSYFWADSAVAYLYQRGIVTGAGNNMFHPGSRMTRGDFMLMVCKAFGFEETGHSNFSDVVPGSYYYNAISAAKLLGIAQGSSGMFYPAGEITRQDAAVIITRALNAAGLYLQSGSSGDLSSFSDAASVSDYAVQAMASLVRTGILVGSGNKLNPKGVMSRAEMSVMLYRVLTM